MSTRSSWLWPTTLAVALALSGCGGGGGGGTPAPPSGPIAGPAPAPPAPPPPAGGIPFGLAASQVFTTFGWASRTGGAPSAHPGDMPGVRWSAGAQRYEVLLPGLSDWAPAQLRFPGSGNTTAYVVTGPSGAVLDYHLTIYSVQDAVGLFLWGHGTSPPAGAINGGTVAFGLPTAAGDVPAGTRSYAITSPPAGNANLVFDFTAGTLSGQIGLAWVDDWGPYPPRLGDVIETEFAPGGRSFTARFSIAGAPTTGTIEGMFFGTQAREVAIRWTGPVYNPYSEAWETMTGVWVGRAG